VMCGRAGAKSKRYSLLLAAIPPWYNMPERTGSFDSKPTRPRGPRRHLEAAH
jgi:hypothetical protein